MKSEQVKDYKIELLTLLLVLKYNIERSEGFKGKRKITLLLTERNTIIHLTTAEPEKRF